MERHWQSKSRFVETGWGVVEREKYTKHEQVKWWISVQEGSS